MTLKYKHITRINHFAKYSPGSILSLRVDTHINHKIAENDYSYVDK